MILTKPITAHGEEKTELVLRAPTAEEVMEIGFPFSVARSGETTPLADKVGRYIVKLAGVPMTSVKQLAPQDFMAATGEVLGFFGESAEER